VHDTGHGYPALLAGDGTAPGWVVPVRDPAALLARLDDYEGPEYRRVRVATADGEAAWAYLWAASRARLDPLPHGWPA
jgi:gamma-glutamylcyclotransferase (GGCT)/AIG2-like uncharacterized protein YtfP